MAAASNFKPLILSVVTIFFVTSLMGAFSTQQLEGGNAQIKAVVTILPQAEFVEKVGGERVEVIVMVPPGASPHTYEPSPRQLVEISDADVYFQMGSGIDFELSFMDKIREINHRMHIVNCSRGIRIIDRDPHVWLSPRNAKIIVKNIYEALVQIDPEGEEYYRENMESYIKELEALDREVREILKDLNDRRFMVYHPAWRYFAMEYNLTQIPVEREGKEPTARGMMALIDQARSLHMKVIFVSPQFDWKKAETIAESIHGRIVFLDPLAKDYIDNLRRVAIEISRSMRQND